MAIRSTGRPGKPRSDEEEHWPYRDPGHNWEPDKTSLPFDWSGITVDWEPSDKKIGSLFLPDGEELEIWSDPIPFGFERYRHEQAED